MKFWQVDAFTDKLFSGNPAAVFIFDQMPDDELMQNIACEMNLAETAFVVGNRIRWFTPKAEVDLCGHATIAAAHILWEQNLITGDRVDFQSRSGPISVTRSADGYTLDFPLQPHVPADNPLDVEAIYSGSNGHDRMVVVSKEDLLSYVPDHVTIAALPERGLVLTAAGDDYLYRAFFPKLNVHEDPVTGSANTGLAPYWAQQLNKTTLKAHQCSARGGDLTLHVTENRVHITGHAITAFEGSLRLKI